MRAPALDAHRDEIWREAATMVLYVSVVEIAELAALPESHFTNGVVSGPVGAGLLAIVWGTAIGLALAHWFAFRIAARAHDFVGLKPFQGTGCGVLRRADDCGKVGRRSRRGFVGRLAGAVHQPQDHPQHVVIAQRRRLGCPGEGAVNVSRLQSGNPADPRVGGRCEPVQGSYPAQDDLQLLR